MKTQQEYQDFSEQHWRNHTPSDSLRPANVPGYGAILLKAWDEAQATTQPDKEELVEFNLEEALREPERVRFRNGETPLEWHYFASLTDFPIHATHKDGGYVTLVRDGLQGVGQYTTQYDLMLAKKKRLVWFGLYENLDGILNTTGIYNDEDLTKRYCEKNNFKLLKLYSYEL